MPNPGKPITVRLTDLQRAAIEAQFARFEAQRPGQRATLAGVLRTLALEWAADQPRTKVEQPTGTVDATTWNHS